jgi:predicted dehydrogenase
MDAASARSVVRAAHSAGVFCMEAMWTRFLPHVVRVRELLADGVIGQVRTVVADHGQRFEPDPANRLYDPELGGGALLDLGIYPVSWAWMVLGRPCGVTAVGDPAFTGVDAQTSVVLRYPDGAHAVLTCTLEARTPCRAWIAGTQGSIEVDPTFYAPTSFTVHRAGDSTRYPVEPQVSAGPGKGLRFQAIEVGRRIRAGELESPLMPLSESVGIMETMDEIRRQTGLDGSGPRRGYGMNDA